MIFRVERTLPLIYQILTWSSKRTSSWIHFRGSLKESRQEILIKRWRQSEYLQLLRSMCWLWFILVSNQIYFAYSHSQYHQQTVTCNACRKSWTTLLILHSFKAFPLSSTEECCSAMMKKGWEDDSRLCWNVAAITFETNIASGAGRWCLNLRVPIPRAPRTYCKHCSLVCEYQRNDESLGNKARSQIRQQET